MAIMIVRVALSVLAVGFVGWWLYITYLGLKEFFKPKNKNNK